jgi:hypothetical protein
MNTLNRATYYKNQIIANLAVNSLLNGLIAYYAYRGRGPIPLLEMAVDIQITVAIIAFLVSWLGVASARKQVMASGASPVGPSVGGVRLPANVILRALMITVVVMLLYGGLVLTGPLALFSPAGLSNWGYFAFKTLYTGVCGACAALLAIKSVFQEYN